MDFGKWLRLQWDRAAAWACVAAGAVVLVVGWVGVSASAYPAEQLPYMISSGVGGVFLLGLGAMLWLSADLRDEWQKLDRIEVAIRERGILHMEAGQGAFDVATGQARFGPYQPRMPSDEPPGFLMGWLPTGQMPATPMEAEDDHRAAPARNGAGKASASGSATGRGGPGRTPFRSKSTRVGESSERISRSRGGGAD